jgi:sortase A
MLASRRRRRKIVSYALVAIGMILFFLGARDLFYSRFGQDEAEHAFDSSGAPKQSPLVSGEPTEKQAEPKLALGDAVAKLTIPRLDAELYVVEGDHAAELRRGPGHVSGTVMPGQDGNCIIAGHRDTHFRVLKDIRKGDEIVLQTASGQYTYRVKTTQVVLPSNTASLRPSKTAELHLITCYPFYYLGSAPKRFIVEAELQDSAPALNASAAY